MHVMAPPYGTRITRDVTAVSGGTRRGWGLFEDSWDPAAGQRELGVPTLLPALLTGCHSVGQGWESRKHF